MPRIRVILCSYVDSGVQLMMEKCWGMAGSTVCSGPRRNRDCGCFVDVGGQVQQCQMGVHLVYMFEELRKGIRGLERYSCQFGNSTNATPDNVQNELSSSS